MLPDLHIAHLAKAPQQNVDLIRNKLFAFNAKTLNLPASYKSEAIHLFLRDEQHNLYGGIIADISWKALQIYTFWIEEGFRGKGYGVQLMQKAETIARERGCKLILLETTSFHSIEFYRAYGFEEVGKIEDFPEGYTYFYFKYELN